ncbi:MAG TPA: DUF561 domain-containing protein, partial [Clostridia bacterium]|nr:DUF561 domain-containing protein [Clostridia bacterium]
VIAEGMESGGHVGDLTTMAFVPQVADAVNIPVVAAGGIFDGRSFAAALALGASGVQIGTRFIASDECQIHPRVKEVILKARDRDTVLTGFSTGHPVRVIKNKFTRMLEAMEGDGMLPEELEKIGSGKLRSAMIEGDIEYGSIMAGQVSAMVKDIQSVREIIEDIVSGAGSVLERLNAGNGGIK